MGYVVQWCSDRMYISYLTHQASEIRLLNILLHLGLLHICVRRDLENNTTTCMARPDHSYLTYLVGLTLPQDRQTDSMATEKVTYSNTPYLEGSRSSRERRPHGLLGGSTNNVPVLKQMPSGPHQESLKDSPYTNTLRYSTIVCICIPYIYCTVGRPLFHPISSLGFCVVLSTPQLHGIVSFRRR